MCQHKKNKKKIQNIMTICVIRNWFMHRWLVGWSVEKPKHMLVKLLEFVC